MTNIRAARPSKQEFHGINRRMCNRPSKWHSIKQGRSDTVARARLIKAYPNNKFEVSLHTNEQSHITTTLL